MQSYKSKEEATKIAEAVLKKVRGPGWRILAYYIAGPPLTSCTRWDGGWYWELRNRYLTLHPTNSGRFYCSVSDHLTKAKHRGGDQPCLWFDNNDSTRKYPEAAIRAAIQSVSKILTKHADILAEVERLTCHT